MLNFQKNFERSYQVYSLKKKFLPYKIVWKIDLILHLLNGNSIKKQQLDIEQQMQFQDLQNLNQSCLKIIFSNIIDTIYYKNNNQFKTCNIKKKGMFNSWIHALIGNDNSNLIFKYSNKTKQYKISQCQIKKSKENFKCFEMSFQNNNKYLIKFQNQQEMINNMKEFQKKIIQYKMKMNYKQMTKYIDQKTPEKTSCVGFNFTTNDLIIKSATKSLSTNKKLQRILSNQQTKSPDSKKHSQTNIKRNKQQLKPVPHGYQTKYLTDHIIIALRETNQAKIYIEISLQFNISIRKLITLLLIQKSWNRFAVFQDIKKSKSIPNEIIIKRKFDTFQITGDFLQINQKSLYTSFNTNMCMISSQSYHKQDQKDSLYSKSLITIEYKNNLVKIFIQDQLSSNNYNSETLKTILYEIYKEIIKLQIIYNKVLIKNFQAQTIIQNIIEEENSAGAEQCDSQQFVSYRVYRQQKQIQNHSQEVSINDVKIIKPENIQKIVKKQSNNSNKGFKYLSSPNELPNEQYILSIINKQYQKNYFKKRFPQQILKQYQNYPPFYRVDKMIQSKQYQILHDTLQLRFINQQLLDHQKDILKFILRQLGTNLISGKSILNLSLPVQIFQGRTGLQRCAAAYAYAPDLFQPYAFSDPLIQIKQVVAFIASETSAQLVMKKPFNQILGQTFQGYMKGIPIYFEQISHNPAIMAYYSICEEYQMYGNLYPYVDMGVNTGVGGNLSPIHIKFKNGTHFQCYFAPSEIAGLIYGDRKFRFYNKGYILERNKLLYAEFSVQNQKKGVYEVDRKLKVGELIGGIFKVKKQYFDQIDKFKRNYKNLKKFGGISKQYIVQKLNSISGIWFGDILVDNEVINKGIHLYPVQYPKNVLPSDSNLRLDVIYNKINDLVHSQKQKQILQVLQRNDKKLREKYTVKNSSKK